MAISKDTYFQPLLEDIQRRVRPYFGRGKVADYIPALARVDPAKFAMVVAPVSGREAAVGDADEAFSIQSVSKVFTLSLAMEAVGERLYQRVGREPSGNAFNSLVQLEYERGIPRNPFINAGALVVADVLLSRFEDPKSLLLDHLRRLSGNPAIAFDPEVAESERQTGYRNRALANFLKSLGNLENDVDAVLDLYFHQCAIAMSARDLARAFLPFANRGVNPETGAPEHTVRHAKRINSLMMTCGMYDASGGFAYRVGLPGKSGVGGAIACVLPRRLAACVWSPELDETGSSLAGTAALALFTTRTGLSVF
ncbi:MAG: glutaminase [Proteobacteria bacterium]|nr:glutaminase [Pseudomonadota bacterium]